jgi:alkanesulfonate monooxygenase SsuD/methylene tetrahydromethanopterin reductase-like flavin-dependent oxidoreductase (luciferase family)
MWAKGFPPLQSVLSAPIAVACSIATRTKGLWVGMAVHVLPLIHPLRIASTTEDSFSRVGRLGFPIFLSMRGMDVEDLEANLKDYHEAWRQAGHPGQAGDISIRFPMYIAPTDAEAIEDPKESIEAYFQRMRRIFEEGWGRSGTEYWERRQKRIERLEKLTYEEILETKVIFGSPARVIDRLAPFKEMLGLTGFTAELNPGGLLPPRPCTGA